MQNKRYSTCICCLKQETASKEYCPTCHVALCKRRSMSKTDAINSVRKELGINMPYKIIRYDTKKEKPKQIRPSKCKGCWALSWDGVVCMFPRCIKYGFKARRTEEWI